MNLRSAAAVIVNCKKGKRDGGGKGYDYFQNLPDELIIEIFTKLSCGHGLDTIADIKSLGQCSTVSKRFNSLTSLVPTLFISDFAIGDLYCYCPNILNKFKNIRSLRLQYESNTKGVKSHLRHIPYIYTKAIYDPPHNYSIAVISFASVDFLDPDQQEDYPTRSIKTATEDDKDNIIATKLYASALFYLHRMLLSSIRDHKLLQNVVVTDSMRRESFTLVEEQLVQLRNMNADITQVQGCQRTGFCNVLSTPLSDCKILFKNLTFTLTEEWRENSTRQHVDDIPQFEGSTGIVLQKVMERILKMEADIRVNYTIVPKMVCDELTKRPKLYVKT